MKITASPDLVQYNHNNNHLNNYLSKIYLKALVYIISIDLEKKFQDKRKEIIQNEKIT